MSKEKQDEDLAICGSNDFLADRGIADPDEFRVKSHLYHEIATITEQRGLAAADLARRRVDPRSPKQTRICCNLDYRNPDYSNRSQLKAANGSPLREVSRNHTDGVGSYFSRGPSVRKVPFAKGCEGPARSSKDSPVLKLSTSSAGQSAVAVMDPLLRAGMPSLGFVSVSAHG